MEIPEELYLVIIYELSDEWSIKIVLLVDGMGFPLNVPSAVNNPTFT